MNTFETSRGLFFALAKKGQFNFFQKLLKFEGHFDLDGQGQGHQFRIQLGHV